MGVEGQDPDDKCGACKVPREQHSGFKHTFVEKDQDPGSAIKQAKKKEQPAKQQIVIAPAPDLILRHVLLKNLITTEQLLEAERELTFGIESHGETTNVQPESGHDSGDGSDRTQSSAE